MYICALLSLMLSGIVYIYIVRVGKLGPQLYMCVLLYAQQVLLCHRMIVNESVLVSLFDWQ